MKRSKLCIGFLILFVPVVLSCLMFSDTSALKHEYQGLSLLTPALPVVSHDSNNYINWSDTSYSFNTFHATYPLYLEFKGDSWSDSLSSLRVRRALRLVRSSFNSTTNKCQHDNEAPNPGFNSIYTSSASNPGISSSNPTFAINGEFISSFGTSYFSNGYLFIPDAFENSKLCWSRDGMTNIDTGSYDYLVNNGLPSWPNEREPLIYNVSTVINNDHIFPYNYYTDTFSFQSSHKQSDGVVYNKRFSFNTIFNQKITKFSKFEINLDEYGGYWYDDSNFYNGRDIDFHFLFQFDNNFTLADSFIHGGSLQLEAVTVPKVYNYSPSGQVTTNTYTCNSTVRQVGENGYYWDIDCPVTLDKDYIIFVPSLVIDGNDNKVFETDGDWYFSSLYIVTDNDSTPGRSFNDNPTGNTNIWDAYWTDNNNQANPGDADWLQTLASLFSFDFFNPFSPIFQMFSDNNSCAQIPVLAGMIHSEETQVCPWFDSTTRNIVTPVLGLASMMLVFGFAVRWLGSSSGNMFEDSGQHDISSNSTLRSKWRKK